MAAPFALAWAVYFSRLAVKVKHAGQCPPPGARVPIRNQIRRGRRATAMWIAMLVIAAIPPVVFLAVLFASYLTFHLVADAAAHNPHRTFPLTEEYALATTVQQIPPAVMADLSARMKHDPRLANPGGALQPYGCRRRSQPQAAARSGRPRRAVVVRQL